MMELTEQKKLEINKRHEANGVRFMDINTAYITKMSKSEAVHAYIRR